MDNERETSGSSGSLDIKGICAYSVVSYSRLILLTTGGKERRVKVDLLLLDVSNESKMLNTYM